MNKQEFKEAMKKGLGSCVIELMDEGNRNRFKDIVLWGCVHNTAFDTQCEGTRANYIYSLVSLYNDKEYFLEPTINAFYTVKSKFDWDVAFLCDLVYNFAKDGSTMAKEALDKKYDFIYNLLLYKKPSKKYDFDRDCLDRLAIALFKLNPDSFDSILSDMSKLFKENPQYDMYGFDWFFQEAMDSLCIRKYNSALKRHGIEKPVSEKATSKKQVIIPTFDEIINDLNSTGKICHTSMGRFIKSGSDEDKDKLASYIVKEADKDKILALLPFFGFTLSSELDHSFLIKLVLGDDEELCDAALEIITSYKGEDIRELAIELLNKGKKLSYAIAMLVYNYKKCDKEILTSSVYKLRIDKNDSEYWHFAFMRIIDSFEDGISLPKELALYIYGNTLCSYCRYCIVRIMSKHRWLNERIINECKYDCNDEIVKLASRRKNG